MLASTPSYVTLIFRPQGNPYKIFYTQSLRGHPDIHSASASIVEDYLYLSILRFSHEFVTVTVNRVFGHARHGQDYALSVGTKNIY